MTWSRLQRESGKGISYTGGSINLVSKIRPNSTWLQSRKGQQAQSPGRRYGVQVGHAQVGVQVRCAQVWTGGMCPGVESR